MTWPCRCPTCPFSWLFPPFCVHRNQHCSVGPNSGLLLCFAPPVWVQLPQERAALHIHARACRVQAPGRERGGEMENCDLSRRQQTSGALCVSGDQVTSLGDAGRAVSERGPGLCRLTLAWLMPGSGRQSPGLSLFSVETPSLGCCQPISCRLSFCPVVLALLDIQWSGFLGGWSSHSVLLLGDPKSYGLQQGGRSHLTRPAV